MAQEHRRAFGNVNKAGCICGYVATKNASDGANRQLVRHLVKPDQHPVKIARLTDHTSCTVEQWADKWGVCKDHSVYVDLSGRAPAPEQTELTLNA